MADTGVPSAISKSYADPSQAYNFLGGVIPQMSNVTEAVKRTGIEQQGANTSQFNAQTARLAELRAQKMTEASLRKADLDLALDAALFDTNVAKANADLQRTVLMNSVAKQKADTDLNNDGVWAGFIQWTSALNPEDVALGRSDAQFNEWLGKAKGMEAMEKMQAAYLGARQRAFGMSAAAVDTRWSPEVGAKLKEGWANLSPAQREYRIVVGNARQAELDLVAKAKVMNEKLRVTAPELMVDPEAFRTGEPDEFGNPVYDTFRLQNALSQTEAEYATQASVVGGARKNHEAALGSKEEQKKRELTSLVKQLENIDDNLARLATARDSGNPDLMQTFIATALQDSLAKKGIDTEVASKLNSPKAEEREAARTRFFTEMGAKWGAEQARLQQAVNAKVVEQPRKQFAVLTAKVKTASSDLKKMEEALSEGWITADKLEAQRALTAKAAAELNEFLGSTAGDAHTFYDGTYKVNPAGL